MDWQSFTLSEVSDQASAGRVLRCPEVEAWMRREGFTRLGMLKASTDIPALRHPDMVEQILAVWLSPDGGTTVQAERAYDVDLADFWSLLVDGTLIRTRWATRAGGLPAEWSIGDPRNAPDLTAAKGSQLRLMDTAALLAASHSPAAGCLTERVDETTVAEAWTRHQARLTAHSGPQNVVVSQTLTVHAALQRRAFDVLKNSRSSSLDLFVTLSASAPALILLLGLTAILWMLWAMGSTLPVLVVATAWMVGGSLGLVADIGVGRLTRLSVFRVVWGGLWAAAVLVFPYGLLDGGTSWYAGWLTVAGVIGASVMVVIARVASWAMEQMVAPTTALAPLSAQDLLARYGVDAADDRAWMQRT